MCAVTNVAHHSKQLFSPGKRVKNGIPKHLDKSSFDQLVQLCKLLFPQSNQIANIIKYFCNLILLFNIRKIKRKRIENRLGQVFHCCPVRFGSCVRKDALHLINKKTLI